MPVPKFALLLLIPWKLVFKGTIGTDFYEEKESDTGTDFFGDKGGTLFLISSK